MGALAIALVVVPFVVGVLVPQAVADWPAHGGCFADPDVVADNDRLEAWAGPCAAVAALLVVAIAVMWGRVLGPPATPAGPAAVTALVLATPALAVVSGVALFVAQGAVAIVLVPMVVCAIAAAVAVRRSAGGEARQIAVAAALVTCSSALASGVSWDAIIAC